MGSNLKTMKNIIFPILLILFSSTAFSQDTTFDIISKTFLKKDSQGLGNQMANTLDLSIGNDDGTFGKQQAIVLLKDFFTKNDIKTFKIKHQGASNERTHYAVCDIKTDHKQWSVYILLNKESKIIQLQIEDL